MAERVRTAVDRVVSTWSATSAEFGYDRATRAVLVGHMKRIPLLRGDSRTDSASARADLPQSL